MGKVKKLFDINFIHLEIRRGTQQQARDYCQKHDTRVDGPGSMELPTKLANAMISKKCTTISKKVLL